jgi:hypothetical protein
MNKPPDELACEVIQQVLKARERFSAGIAGCVNWSGDRKDDMGVMK